MQRHALVTADVGAPLAVCRRSQRTEQEIAGAARQAVVTGAAWPAVIGCAARLPPSLARPRARAATRAARRAPAPCRPRDRRPRCAPPRGATGSPPRCCAASMVMPVITLRRMQRQPGGAQHHLSRRSTRRRARRRRSGAGTRLGRTDAGIDPHHEGDGPAAGRAAACTRSRIAAAGERGRGAPAHEQRVGAGAHGRRSPRWCSGR